MIVISYVAITVLRLRERKDRSLKDHFGASCSISESVIKVVSAEWLHISAPPHTCDHVQFQLQLFTSYLRNR